LSAPEISCVNTVEVNPPQQIEKMKPKSNSTDNRQGLLPLIRNAAKKVAIAMLQEAHRGFITDVVAHTESSFFNTFDDDLLPSKPEAWASKVAYNKAICVLRRESRMLEVIEFSNDIDGAEAYGVHNSAPSPAEFFETEERKEAVLRVLHIINDAVLELEPEEQKLYNQIFKQRLPMCALADERGENPNTISKRWGRMLKSLAEKSLTAVRNDILCSEVFASLLLSSEKWTPAVMRLIREAVNQTSVIL
jgi:RNA polymerase sigma factor (sigma-70 family)